MVFSDTLEYVSSKVRKIDQTIMRASIMIWIFLLLFIVGSNELHNPQSLEDPSLLADSQQPNITFRNCEFSTQNQRLTPALLRTNIDMGYYDILLDTQSDGISNGLIPAITNPKFMSLDKAKNCLNPKQEILVIEMSQFKSCEDNDSLEIDECKEVRIYPVSILSRHRIINDRMKDERFTIVYSPLADNANVFLNSSKDNFAASGRLLFGLTLFKDDATDSLWNPLEGKAVIGDRTGEKFQQMFSKRMKFSEIFELYPQGRVFSFETGYTYDYDENTYQDYWNAPSLPVDFQFVNDRIQPKDKVYAALIDNDPFAFFPLVSRDFEKVLQNGKDLNINYDNTTNNFELYVTDSTEGKTQIPVTQVYYFAWKLVYPDAQAVIVE